ncbi:MAG: glutamate-5-semialdehyde dehydrogenase [Acidobacteria bacterium]|nr:glutamate-5-semialdehyde dehydrogenase [Acidobacteriota bacterium]
MTQLNQAAKDAKQASRQAAHLSHEQRCRALRSMARALIAHKDIILSANEVDLAIAKEAVAAGEMSEPLAARLKLTEQRLIELADGIKQIAAMDDPLGKVLMSSEPQPGIHLSKVTVPIGVLAVIFESRPDALPQITALAVKTGNALLLKGGREAAKSNRILFDVTQKAIEDVMPAHLIHLIESREAMGELLKMDDEIDLVIPRGSSELVRAIQQQTKIPVMGHAEGICHVYVDEHADPQMALNICLDAKTNYPAACNAVETILVHDHHHGPWLDQLCDELTTSNVSIYAGPNMALKKGFPPAPSLHWEYSDLAVTLELVPNLDHAIEHINTYGSGHTDTIVTESEDRAHEFLQKVDSASVFHNISTRFADGFRYGFGAEVGISTGRLHARGPVGLDGLVTYAYRAKGHGYLVGKKHKKIWPVRAASLMQLF